MASNRNLKSDDVDGFMLAVWDSIEDLQDKYGVSIDISIHNRKQRGHIVYRAVARRDFEDKPDWVVATSEAVWPTHYAKTTHALLYALLVRLWRELDIWIDQHQRPAGSPTD